MLKYQCMYRHSKEVMTNQCRNWWLHQFMQRLHSIPCDLLGVSEPSYSIGWLFYEQDHIQYDYEYQYAMRSGVVRNYVHRTLVLSKPGTLCSRNHALCTPSSKPPTLYPRNHALRLEIWQKSGITHQFLTIKIKPLTFQHKNCLLFSLSIPRLRHADIVF